MKFRHPVAPVLLFFFLGFFLLQFVPLSSLAQYTKLVDFGNIANGRYPRSSPISDGTFLYAMTTDGGSNGAGTIFKIKPDGSGFAKLLDFDGPNNGANPYGALLYDGTFLYGMTIRGGVNSAGTIFKIKPDGSGYLKLLDFAYAATGAFPLGSLILDGGFLFGMTTQGGSGLYGTAFKIKADGSGFAKLVEFDYTNNGGFPQGSLFSDGTFLYGMTQAGGPTSNGTIFKVKPDGTGYLQLLNFVGSNGSAPYGSLVSDGAFLYGMTPNGGTGNFGTIFKIKPDGSGYAKIQDFDSSTKGANPKGSLVYDGAFLYGMTTDYGANGRGTIFKLKTDGTGFVKLLDNDVGTNGPFPEGTLSLVGSVLFGVKSGGGAGVAPFYPGAIFKINTDGTGYTKLYNFKVGASNPVGSLTTIGTTLYGLSNLGGLLNYGTLFKINTNGTGYGELFDFDNATSGGNPPGRPIYDGTAFLYGMTSQGGTNDAGTVYKIKPDGSGFAKLLDFDGSNNGSNPNGSLIFDGTYLFGATPYGGSLASGTLFKILPSGAGYVKLLDFDFTATGAYPQGSLIGVASFLYGTTGQGGANSQGTIFKVDTNGALFSTLLDFDGTNGANPHGSLVFDGTFLYGLTNSGGANNNGTIFKIKPDGSGFTTLYDFNGNPDGSAPNGSLLLSGTTLFGMTTFGGQTDYGTVFKIQTDGTNYAKVLDFSDGRYPKASLTSDGTFLYGTTENGGANAAGILFKVSLAPFTSVSDFSPFLGVEGTYVTIHGTNFNPIAANNVVKFNGITAEVRSGTTTSLDVIVPTGATTGPVTVTALGTGTSATNFFVTAAATMFNGIIQNCDVTFIAPGGSDDATQTFVPVNSSDKVRVSFSSFDVGDLLYVYDGPDTSSPLIATLSGSITPDDIVATGPGGELTFEFIWQDDNSEWEATITCEKVVVMSTGAVVACNFLYLDPGGSHDYSFNQDFTQTFTPTSSGDKISVSFLSFSTEGCCDKLFVHDGPTTASPLVATLFGDTLPADITATGAGGELTFHFQSDGDVESSGWLAQISCGLGGPVITVDTQPSDFIACEGEIATFSTSASGVTNISYHWQYSSGGTNPFNDIVNGGGYSNATTATLSVNTVGTFGVGRYRCRINGDLAEEVVTNDEGLFINPTPPAPSTVNPPPVCGPVSVSLTVSGGTVGQYVWYTVPTGGTPISGQTSDTYDTPILSTTTTYYVATNDGTCESARTPAMASILICNPPTIAPTISTGYIEGVVTIDLTQLITDIDNNIDQSTLQIVSQPESGAPATLTGYILTIDYSGFPYFSADQVGIEICDLTGLCATQQIAIEFAGDITIFNAFSPNGDGKNEFLFLQYIEVIPGKQHNEVRIYNRWGDEVFSISDYNNSSRVFTGISSSGNKLPSGTYFYKISFASGEKSRTGVLELRY